MSEMLGKLDGKAVVLDGHLLAKALPPSSGLLHGGGRTSRGCCHVDELMLPVSVYAHPKQEQSNDKFSFLAGIVYFFS